MNVLPFCITSSDATVLIFSSCCSRALVRVVSFTVREFGFILGFLLMCDLFFYSAMTCCCLCLYRLISLRNLSSNFGCYTILLLSYGSTRIRSLGSSISIFDRFSTVWRLCPYCWVQCRAMTPCKVESRGVMEFVRDIWGCRVVDGVEEWVIRHPNSLFLRIRRYWKEVLA